MTKSEALRKVQMYSFALVDTGLFLDTHPTNKAALMFFEDTINKYREALEEYEKNYGPMTPGSVDVSKSWEWVETPWPWEMEE